MVSLPLGWILDINFVGWTKIKKTNASEAAHECSPAQAVCRETRERRIRAHAFDFLPASAPFAEGIVKQKMAHKA